MSRLKEFLKGVGSITIFPGSLRRDFLEKSDEQHLQEDMQKVLDDLRNGNYRG